MKPKVKSISDLMEHTMFGDSPAMQALADQIAVAARSNVSVLVTGASGTGKESVAYAIHQQSRRAGMPFISVNCCALTENSFESELRLPRRARASIPKNPKNRSNGILKCTLFLDEVGELSTACQIKLLRILQNPMRAVAANQQPHVDVRVIAATDRDLAQEVALGRFRPDLFYRIAVLMIRTPSLRDHSSDIPQLVEHFLGGVAKKLRPRRHFSIESDGIDALCQYSWHGNVRQLRYVVERLAATAHGALITSEEVRRSLVNTTLLTEAVAQLRVIFREDESLDDFLDRTFLDLYKHVRALGGGHSQAARLFHVDRIALYQRVQRARQRVKRSAMTESRA